MVADYGAAGLRGIGGWRLSAGHFAERHGLIIIIALGESIVAVGVALAGAELGAGEIAGTALGLVVAASFWWIYFDSAAEAAERALHATPAGRPRNTMARDSYSYLHLPMAAGIVLLALGVVVARVERLDAGGQPTRLAQGTIRQTLPRSTTIAQLARVELAGGWFCVHPTRFFQGR
jgi:low temperature requirement protein LtrA